MAKVAAVILDTHAYIEIYSTAHTHTHKMYFIWSNWSTFLAMRRKTIYARPFIANDLIVFRKFVPEKWRKLTFVDISTIDLRLAFLSDKSTNKKTERSYTYTPLSYWPNSADSEQNNIQHNVKWKFRHKICFIFGNRIWFDHQNVTELSRLYAIRSKTEWKKKKIIVFK